MLDELIQAAAVRLRALWPDCPIYDGPIPLDAGGAFHVGIVRAEQSAGLGRRRRQRAQLEVRYYLPGTGGTDFGPWSQRMLDGFRTLEGAGGKRVGLRQPEALPDGGEGYYAFRVWVDVSYVEEGWKEDGEEPDMMEHLEQKEKI